VQCSGAAFESIVGNLVRNALDHGLESPAERKGAGKAERGRLEVRAVAEGAYVLITVRDDGRGMDPKRLISKAVDKGLISPAEASVLSKDRALDLIFRPGFSTADKVTEISGRGVGMDIVRTTLHKLQGTLRVESEVGGGTTFIVKLPRGMITCRGILVEDGGESYVLPVEDIQELTKVRRSEVHSFQALRFMSRRGGICPVVSLSSALGRAEAEPRWEGAASSEWNAAVVSTREGALALLVDRLQSEVEVLVKPLANGLSETSIFQGAAILGDGRVALVLAPSELGAVVAGGVA
jgi:two-component system chemotaxis sensor kinase CheA